MSRCVAIGLLLLGLLAGLATPGFAADKKKIAFLAGRPSHGYGSHDHYAGCMVLAQSLEQTMGYECKVFKWEWPKDPAELEGYDCLVMYSDGGGGHPANAHAKEVDALAKKGVGIVCIHYAVETTKGEFGDRFIDWIGGFFEPHWSVNPHWTAKFEKFPDHPISRGVKPFAIDDEWYYHMRFREGMKGVTPILTDLPPKETLSRGDGPHSGNPAVRASVLERKEPQHVAWAAEREGGGRGFGFTGGHNHWNWGDENFRRVVLNAIVWCAKGEVPASGVGGKPLTVEDLEKNIDETQPANFNRDQIRQKFKLPGGTGEKKPEGKSSAAAKPKFSSPVVTTKTPGHAVPVECDITGAAQLYLVVTDGGNGFGCDWADWAEPRLVGPSGEKKLTDLTWKNAAAGHGEAYVGKNSGGKELSINGKPVAYGIGTHAVSVIAYDLPSGYTKFVARGGLDNGGTDQATCGEGASVQFHVFTTSPASFVSANAATNAPAAGGKDPADAVTNLDVADGLEATLVSSEPKLLSLTNLDIDARGRIWVCEVVNYRGNNGKRPEGDRILILEDKDGDGKADETKVFYQGRDIDSAMGVCVLGNKVIVTCSPNVFVFTDANGDDKPDGPAEKLFTKTGGAQHDHSAHSFLFGPDGKLYWNFGNTGQAVHDKNGNVVVDKEGNKVQDNGKPYFGGMPFRCNLDGSDFEVLGHNFRNNYEVTVDSLGTLWQSDNDDDGNKGVRINYVMEHGNFGYRDEVTGAGWNSPRTNLEKEIPLRHWHLNDPGVVPNLLQTGAGSPTGICIYEGRLLPKVFWDQVIHCDAGPSVVRAYPATKDGAGYKAETVNILQGARDNWFRPADVCVAPDGSIFVTDWYDPGVGGHGQRDIERGRLFRVAPPGSKYTVPKFDFNTIEGCIAALQNPALSVRYLAWTNLHAKGKEAEAALTKLFETSDNDRIRARALWLLGKIEGRGQHWVEVASKDKSADIRVVSVRLAKQLGSDVIPTVKSLVKDAAPEVRRECALALRHCKDGAAAELWAELAAQHDGKDRWYLEALGISADGNWDTYLAAWLKKAGNDWNTPAGRDIIWRSRAKATPELLVKIVQGLKPDETPRYMRAFDFLKGPEKDAALKSLLGL